ncbi:histone-lysine N-methyltransferase SETMAR [Trichonephila clavipes]|nr:histone-lysine N-methyltransferase SETMAR [Trichonephila clavipes]
MRNNVVGVGERDDWVFGGVGWDVFGHPSYSPDLTPSDFHLFLHLKSFLAGKHFNNDKELKENVSNWLKTQAATFYEEGIEKLVPRYDTCLQNFGNYVERSSKAGVSNTLTAGRMWPAGTSCDLPPLDYFLWGYAKSLVYADKPQTLDPLEDNIRLVIADIRPQILEKVIENWTSRLDYIRASRGSPMPEIIFKIFHIVVYHSGKYLAFRNTSIKPTTQIESRLPGPISASDAVPDNSLNTSTSSLSTETCPAPTTSNKFTALQPSEPLLDSATTSNSELSNTS